MVSATLAVSLVLIIFKSIIPLCKLGTISGLIYIRKVNSKIFCDDYVWDTVRGGPVPTTKIVVEMLVGVWYTDNKKEICGGVLPYGSAADGSGYTAAVR